jgi:hypothetical protein
MAREQMALFKPALLRLGQLAEYLPQVLAQVAIQHLAAALRYKYNVVLAIPLRVA